MKSLNLPEFEPAPPFTSCELSVPETSSLKDEDQNTTYIIGFLVKSHESVVLYLNSAWHQVRAIKKKTSHCIKTTWDFCFLVQIKPDLFYIYQHQLSLVLIYFHIVHTYNSVEPASLDGREN